MTPDQMMAHIHVLQSKVNSLEIDLVKAKKIISQTKVALQNTLRKL